MFAKKKEQHQQKKLIAETSDGTKSQNIIHTVDDLSISFVPVMLNSLPGKFGGLWNSGKRIKLNKLHELWMPLHTVLWRICLKFCWQFWPSGFSRAEFKSL